MAITVQHLMIYGLVVIFAISAFADNATFHIHLVQNNAPSSTLFSSIISVEKDKVSISSTGYSSPLWEMVWERNHSEYPRFEDHLVIIEDDRVAADFLTIARHFELCQEDSEIKLISGGISTKIECVREPKAPAKVAYYIAVNPSNRRSYLMEGICRDVQELVVSDFLKDDASRKNTLDSLRAKIAKLEENISVYIQALSLLEDAYRKQLPANWTKIIALAQFAPNQPPLEKRSRLVQTAHDILTASCSGRGLHYILGNHLSDESALILKIGEVRRCRGSFSYPDNPDWGFDDVGMSLGLVYPPHEPGLRIGILVSCAINALN